MFKKKIPIEGISFKIRVSVSSMYKALCRGLYFIERFIIEGISIITKYVVKILSFVILKMKTSNIQLQVLYSVLGIFFALIFALFYYYKLRGF